MKLRPLHDRVVVRRVKEEEKTKGGLVLLVSGLQRSGSFAAGIQSLLMRGRRASWAERNSTRPI